MPVESPWLNVSEAAAYCRCSRSTVLREARRGARLVAYKLAGRRSWRFRTSDLDNFITSQSAVAAHRPNVRVGRD